MQNTINLAGARAEQKVASLGKAFIQTIAPIRGAVGDASVAVEV
jgi:hypothetical protein